MHYEKFSDGTVKCIEDEISFEVPEGWAWCRVASVTSILTDGEHKTPHRCESFKGFYLLSARNIRDGFIALDDVDYVDEQEFERISARCNPKRNDVLISCSGTVGRITVVADENHYVMVRSAAMLRLCEIDPCFVMYVLQSGFLQGQMQSLSKQTAQANLFQGAIASLLIPIPPLKEQLCISTKVKKLSNYIDEIETSRNDVASSVSLIKAHILDLAIRGKLVPQNPDDEPASVLLDSIRIEKEELVKQGKINQDKRESVIYRGEDNSYYEKVGNQQVCIDDDLPYSLPEGWIWCELQDCCLKEIRRGRSPKYAEKGHVLSFAQKCNQKTGDINMGLALWIDDSTTGRYEDDEYMRDGDIVINSTGTGTLGRVGIYRSTDNPAGLPVVSDSHVTVVRVSSHLDPLYFYIHGQEKR